MARTEILALRITVSEKRQLRGAARKAHVSMATLHRLALAPFFDVRGEPAEREREPVRTGAGS